MEERSMDRHYFNGTTRSYTNAGPINPAQLGCWIINEARTLRKVPQGNSCELCSRILDASGLPSAAFVECGGENYLAIPNVNPIVKGQFLLMPCGNPATPPPGHREILETQDVQLALKLARYGVKGLRYEALGDTPVPFPGRAGELMACYANLVSSISGRSQPHTHKNVVPAAGLPIPVVRPSDWPICRGIGGASISAVEGLPYKALIVEGSSDEDRADTVKRLGAYFSLTGRSYNVLVFPSQRLGRSSGQVDVLCVPRCKGMAEAVGQRIGGLELMTGVLIPAPEFHDDMTTARRDQALRQVTLDDVAWLELVRELRQVFGMELSGLAVFADKVQTLVPA